MDDDLKAAGQQIHQRQLRQRGLVEGAQLDVDLDLVADLDLGDGLAVLHKLAQDFQALGHGLRGHRQVKASLGDLVERRQRAAARDQQLLGVRRKADRRQQALGQGQRAHLVIAEDLRDAQACDIDQTFRSLRVGVQGQDGVGSRQGVKAILDHGRDHGLNRSGGYELEALGEVAGQKVQDLGIAGQRVVEV